MGSASLPESLTPSIDPRRVPRLELLASVAVSWATALLARAAERRSVKKEEGSTDIG